MILGESQWMIGSQIGIQNNDSFPVFGWEYSDEQYIWPNVTTLEAIGKKFIQASCDDQTLTLFYFRLSKKSNSETWQTISSKL